VYMAQDSGATVYAENITLSSPSTPKIQLTDTTNTCVSVLKSGNTSAIVGTTSNHAFRIDTNDTAAIIIDTSQCVYIGDDANANMTQGLTINQGANDDEALALKSSDVAHGLANWCETDTYFTLHKSSATLGGVNIRAFAEDAALASPMQFISYGGTATTDKDTSGVGLVNFQATEQNGSDAVADITADGNVFSVRARKGSAWATVFIVDEDGDLFADSGTTTDAVTVYDDYDDAQLVRAFDTHHSPKAIIQNKFDDYIKYNKDTLVETGLLGDVPKEKEEEGHRGLVNLTGMQRLHNGAIWQQYTEMQKMKELMYDTMVELIGKEKADAKLKDHDIKLLDENTLLN